MALHWLVGYLPRARGGGGHGDDDDDEEELGNERTEDDDVDDGMFVAGPVPVPLRKEACWGQGLGRVGGLNGGRGMYLGRVARSLPGPSSCINHYHTRYRYRYRN